MPSRSCTSSAPQIPTIEPRSDRAAHESGPADATEHSVAPHILLTVADLDDLQASEATIKPTKSLHRLARAALNGIIDAGVINNINRNLEHWFPWRRYLACHTYAYDIIGTGVTHATAEYISETRDPNRRYQKRLDFVIYRADGTICRLHPGTKQKMMPSRGRIDVTSDPVLSAATDNTIALL